MIEPNASIETHPLPTGVVPGQPLTALAPMQDVTDLPFMQVINGCGSPDFFFTEYFRVTLTSRLERHILRSIVENDTGRPVFAQMIGEDIENLTRTAEELAKHAVAGIDLNLGCPAPKVYNKNVGGGLLRDPDRIDAIFAALRASVDGRFTVKMRIGFDSAEHFETILDLVNTHRVDLLSLHGRTVKQMYRGDVDYDRIRQAVETARCPVLANGNITSVAVAEAVLAQTGAAGVMIGRSAIRNPWIFHQLRTRFSGEPIPRIQMTEVRDYVERLYRATGGETIPERSHINRMKKFLNFVGQGVDPEGRFLYEMRRTQTEAELFEVCDRHLLDPGNPWFADEPFPGVIARPNRES